MKPSKPGNDPSQPQKGGQQQQQQPGEGRQYGEGNYKATRDYNSGVKDHMEHHDVEKEARDAAPRTEEEAREMDEAERQGRDRARGPAKAGDDPKVN